jgi:hypothetical protein
VVGRIGYSLDIPMKHGDRFKKKRVAMGAVLVYEAKILLNAVMNRQLTFMA